MVNWKEGEHEATSDEVEAVYGLSTDQRKRLMRGLREATNNLEQAGIKKIWIDGSFVTTKAQPNDIDGCWEYNDSIDLTVIDPVFLSHNARNTAKKKYGPDFFMAQVIEEKSAKPFPEFFRQTGKAKQRE